MRRRNLLFLGSPQLRPDHPFPYGFFADLEMMFLLQILGRQSGAESCIVWCQENIHCSALNGSVHPSTRRSASKSMDHRLVAALVECVDQALNLSNAETQLFGL